MKLKTAVIGLGFAVCLAGCQSLTHRFEASVTHMAGGITLSDVAAELFRQHIRTATSQVIIIDYSLMIARRTYETGNKRITEYDIDIPGGQSGALSMLQAVLAYDYFSKLGITNTMAVLLCSEETNAIPRVQQVYKLDREGLPIYVVSSESVAGGVVQHNALSSSILAFAVEQANNHLFPFELPEDYKYELQRDDPINEYRAFKKARQGLLDAWMTAEKANEYQRKRFPQMVAVSWPRHLFPAGEESDILLIQWRNLQGRPKNVGLVSGILEKGLGSWVNTPIGYHHVPASTPLNRCSRISGKDGVVYYYKTVEPKYQANIQDELTKMNAEYQRIAPTLR